MARMIVQMLRPKPRNPVAKALAEPQNAQKVVRSKRKYTRKKKVQTDEA